MLPRGKIYRQVRRRRVPFLPLPALLALLCGIAWPADNPVEPLTVCEVLQDVPAHEGKTLAVLGRFSFRSTGRSLNEETCGDKPASAEPARTPTIRLLDDAKTAPKPPDVFALDAVAISRKLKQVKEHTSLRSFRFGTPDYDRWAVVYGRFEIEKNKDASVTTRLLYRGDGVILFLHDN